MATFPTLSQGQDSKFFTEEKENPAIEAELEGGYTAARPRHTRTPRRTWTTGFSELTNADKTLVNDFWDLVKGGSEGFYWTHPVTSTSILVRFKDKLSWKYTGVKTRNLWEVQLRLEEV